MTSETGTTPGGHERFPGFDVLRERDAWDDVTTGVVLRRLGPRPQLSFFDVSVEPTGRALVDRLLGQDGEPRVPVFELIDQRLSEGDIDGWRYDDMPEDGEAWRRSLVALDADARDGHDAAAFHELGSETQRELLESIRTGDRWHGMPAARVWSLWMRYACAAFYSHPWAWNEIGFPGPAYPRGYANFGLDRREHWERPEVDARDPEPWARRIEQARRGHRPGSDDHPDTR